MDATFKAIIQLIEQPVQLTKYVVTKIEGGSGPDAPGNDALASVVTHIKTGEFADPSASVQPGSGDSSAPTRGSGGLGGISSEITHTGTGTSTDIIVASARAYVAAINRAMAHAGKA